MSPSLHAELRQRKPFGSVHQEALLNVFRTGALLTDAFERLLEPFGLTLTQYNVLRILRGAEPEGLCRNELRDRMLTRMPDVTRLLDRMAAAGLVRRSREAADRRLVTTRITPEGQRLLRRLDPVVEQEHVRRIGHLSAGQLRTLVELLELVREAP
jgi:DNA-binding MarR family transcriptional regulator